MLPITAFSSIKYDWELDHLLREVILEYPELGPLYFLKAKISDGFYCIELRM